MPFYKFKFKIIRHENNQQWPEQKHKLKDQRKVEKEEVKVKEEKPPQPKVVFKENHTDGDQEPLL